MPPEKVLSFEVKSRELFRAYRIFHEHHLPPGKGGFYDQHPLFLWAESFCSQVHAAYMEHKEEMGGKAEEALRKLRERFPGR